MGDPSKDQKTTARIAAASEASASSEGRVGDRRARGSRDSNLFYLLYPSYDRRDSPLEPPQIEMDRQEAKEPSSN